MAEWRDQDGKIVIDYLLAENKKLKTANQNLQNALDSIIALYDITEQMSKSLDADIQLKTLGVGKSLRSNARGKQILMLFKIEDLSPLKESDLASVKDLVSEYDRLKGRR